VDQPFVRLKSLFINYWKPRLRGFFREVNLVICESGAPVLLAPLLTKYAPTASLIYQVNDDMRLLNAPAYLVRAEQEI
jgi:2-beta-glucuronyltransferase